MGKKEIERNGEEGEGEKEGREKREEGKIKKRGVREDIKKTPRILPGWRVNTKEGVSRVTHTEREYPTPAARPWLVGAGHWWSCPVLREGGWSLLILPILINRGQGQG